MAIPPTHMDESMTELDDTARLPDGFPGQRMRVLPRPIVAQALRAPTTSQILVTDVGFFPRASYHGRSRPLGAKQNIVIVCAAGRGTCHVPSGAHAVRAGIWWMHVVGSGIAELFSTIGTTAAQPVIALGDPPHVISLIDTVIRRMERDETMSTLLAASGAAWHALALLAADRRSLSRKDLDPVDVAIEHLQANASTRFSLGELAGMAGLSESHFAALFRRSTGYSALEYQIRLRMGLARELLDTTERTISSVAIQVGYVDPLYFSRQFHRIHGISPTEYRSHDKG